MAFRSLLGSSVPTKVTAFNFQKISSTTTNYGQHTPSLLLRALSSISQDGSSARTLAHAKSNSFIEQAKKLNANGHNSCPKRYWHHQGVFSNPVGVSHGVFGEQSFGSNFENKHRRDTLIKRENSTITTAAIMSKEGNDDNNNESHPDEAAENKKESGKPDLSTCPKMALAKTMPMSVRDVGNDILFGLAARGHNDACCEVLRRHIMVTDNVSYETAEEKLKEIRVVNTKGQAKSSYAHLGLIATSVVAGFASFLLVFDINSVLYFNEHYVTMEVPDVQDLQTTLEVGAWSWNWMEPPLGQISFFLLCMQFAKGECEFLGIDPLHDWYRTRRAARLCKQFPQYDKKILRNFSRSEKFFKQFP